MRVYVHIVRVFGKVSCMRPRTLGLLTTTRVMSGCQRLCGVTSTQIGTSSLVLVVVLVLALRRIFH
jgi:hypothetical protein